MWQAGNHAAKPSYRADYGQSARSVIIRSDIAELPLPSFRGSLDGEATMEAIEKLLDPKEVGEILNLKRSKVHQMLASGEIPSIIITKGERRRVFRVKPSALMQWLKRCEVICN